MTDWHYQINDTNKIISRKCPVNKFLTFLVKKYKKVTD